MGPISSFFKIERDPFYKEGIEKGRLEANIQNAKAMKAEGLSDKQISKITKLPIKKVQEL